MDSGTWIIDPDTGEERFVYYDELDEDVVARERYHPLAGFVYPADQFLSTPMITTPFYVKDFLPKQGKVVLYAPAKSGKSYLCAQLARCIGVGEPFLGLETRKGRVLYVQFELGEPILQGRMKSTHKEYENVFVGTQSTMKLDQAVGQKQLASAMSAVEPDVLILDPWGKIISGDENESHDARVILDFLDSLIEAYQCSIFVIHHAGKDLSKRGRGSVVLEDWCDSYLAMQKTSKKGEPMKVTITPQFLRHAALPEHGITATLGEDFEFHSSGESLTVIQQIEKFLEGERKESTFTRSDILNFGIGSNTSVHKAIEELIRSGKIVKKGWGKYEQTRRQV